MLVLTRRENEKVLFPSLGIAVEVVRVKGKTVRLGIDAPKEIRAIRDELIVHQTPPPAPVPRKPCSDREIQQKLDAANLAIHLAQNQLCQGLTDHADEALDQALNCLESLEDSLALRRQLSSTACRVHESPSSYKTGRRKVALIVDDRAQSCSALASQLRQMCFDVILVPNLIEAVNYLSCHSQPHLVLVTRSNSESVAGPDVCWSDLVANEQLRLPGVSGLTRSLKTFCIGDQHVTGWFAPAIGAQELAKFAL